MSAGERRPGFLGYDLFKLIVAIVLLLILILLLLRSCSGAGELAAATQPATQAETTQSVSATAATSVQAPIITTPKDGDHLEQTSITLEGTGAAGTKLLIIEFYDDSGTVLQTVTVGSDGTFSAKIDATEGPHIYLAAVDPGQPTGTVDTDMIHGLTTSSWVHIDVGAAPTATIPLRIAGPRDGEHVEGPVRLQGDGRPGVELAVSDSGTVIGTTTVDRAGHWSFTTTIYNGHHVFTVGTVDGSEQAGPVAVDVTPIVVTVGTATPPTPTPAAASGGSGCSGLISGYLKDKDHYVVGSCDTLSGIAAWLDVSVDSLLAANPQITNPDVVVPGEVVTVPPK